MNFALTLAANKFPGIAFALTPPPDTPVTKIDDGSATRTIVQSTAASSLPATAPSPEAEEQRLESLIVDGGVSPSTRAAVLDQFNAQSQARNAQNQSPVKPLAAAAKRVSPAQAAAALVKQDQLLAGLLLGSPEFQRR
jgi:hypothetical protein